MRSSVASALAVAVIVSWPASVGALRSSTQARTPQRRAPVVPFAVGETLSYDVSWSSFLVAGTAIVSVKDKQPSSASSAYHVVAEGRPIPFVARLYPLYYKMDALFDSDSLLSERGSLYAEEGKDRRTETTRFDRTAKKAFFEEQADATTRNNYAVPSDVQDGLSTLYVLRARTLKAGDRIAIPVADSGGLYRVQLTVSAPERVTVPFGTVDAWGLKGAIDDAAGQAAWKNIAIWISSDARRLPVKLEAEAPIGSFVLALRDAR